MNILICGNQSSVARELSRRLKREKHEIYFISGNSKNEKLDSSVFQEYHFPFLSDQLNRMIEGAAPDTVVIMGAFDTNFDWNMAAQTSIRYVTAMTSLLMGAQSASVKRLIYLSGMEVFDENSASEEIWADTRPQSSSIRLKALIQTEDLLLDYAKNTDDMEIMIVRLPAIIGEMTASPNDVAYNCVSRYFEESKVNVYDNVEHDGIYYRDVVELLIHCIGLPSSELRNIYQLKGFRFNEKELGEAIEETHLQPNAIFTHETTDRPVNSVKTIAESHEEALNLRYRYDLKQAVAALCTDYSASVKKKENESRQKPAILPVIEALAGIVLVYLATTWLNTTRLGGMSYLFYFYVLLFAVSYGTSYGLLTSLFSIITYLGLELQEVSFTQVVGSYSFYLTFLQLVITAVVAGGMHDKFKRKNNNLTENLNYVSAELSDISRINDNNVYVKNVYEKRLIGYQNSLSRIYELTSRLDHMESRAVIFQAVRVISELMEMPDVAIYISNSRSGYMRLMAAGTELARSLGNSVKYEEEFFLYKELSRGNVYMNRSMEKGKPTFASAVYQDGRLLAIIMVWSRNVHQVNLYASDMLALASRLIEKSIGRALLYDELLHDDTYMEGSRIMKSEAFISTTELYEDGKKQGLLDYTVLKVNYRDYDLRSVAAMVRETDCVGICRDELYVLLTGTSAEDAQFVMQRYQAKGMDVEIIDTGAFFKQVKEEANEQ